MITMSCALVMLEMAWTAFYPNRRNLAAPGALDNCQSMMYGIALGYFDLPASHAASAALPLLQLDFLKGVVLHQLCQIVFSTEKVTRALAHGRPAPYQFARRSLSKICERQLNHVAGTRTPTAWLKTRYKSRAQSLNIPPVNRPALPWRPAPLPHLEHHYLKKTRVREAAIFALDTLLL